MDICKDRIKPLTKSGFSLTPYLESFTPTSGLRTPVFPRISSNLHCGTPTFSKRCLWDSYFQNPSENPENPKINRIYDGVETETRNLRLVFSLFKSYARLPSIRLK